MNGEHGLGVKGRPTSSSVFFSSLQDQTAVRRLLCFSCFTLALCLNDLFISLASQLELDAEALERMDELTVQARHEQQETSREKDRLEVCVDVGVWCAEYTHSLCFFQARLLVGW